MKIMQFKKIITLIIFFSSLNTSAYANFESEEKFISNFPASAINILGDEILKFREKKFKQNEFFFDYLKKDIRPGRKMGHITTLID